MTPLAALQADPFLPAVEHLQAEGRWYDGARQDVQVLMANEACHTRPMFELIPDHVCSPLLCCGPNVTDAARWRPL